MRMPRTRNRGSRRRGMVAPLVGLCLLPILGVMAFAMDGGMMMSERRHAQAVADASAHAAACSLYTNDATNQGTDSQGKARTAALAIALGNGYANDGTTSTVVINIPPKSGAFSGQAGYAEAVVSYNQPRYFAAIWGAGTTVIGARAVARGKTGDSSGGVASNASILLLDPSAAGALTATGSAKLNAYWGIQVNSNNAAAVNINNSGYVSAAQGPSGTSPPSGKTSAATSIVGGYSIPNWQTQSQAFGGTVLTNQASVADPLASLAAPTATGMPSGSTVPPYGSGSISPGVYNGLSFGGGASVTMNPGTYYIKGSFNVGNGVSLTGTGVTIYLDGTSGGSASIGGGGVISLSAPSSGTYAGIVLYQDRANANAISINNGSNTTITGTVYAPAAAVNVAGGSSTAQYGSQFIAKTMNLSNNATINVKSTPTNVAPSNVKTRLLGLVE